MEKTKDWFGNSSFFIQNHRKKETEVSQADFYATHPTSVRAFLKMYDLFDSNDHFWEPACGTGNISKVLKDEHHFDVYSTDLVDRGYGDGQLNFLQCMTLPKKDINVILTNPPFKYADAFLEQAMTLLPSNGRYIAFLPLTFLEGKGRYKLFQRWTPTKVFIFSSRQGCDSQGRFEFKNGGARAYAWYVWNDKHTTDTNLFWIPPTD